ncbi:hypothetical protein N7512_010388 [Penicillium capsulatum]|nr:hypothetical protein N7512_010388 [Penicillium capsulatum]
MGHSHSSPVRDCLMAAMGNNSALLSFKDDPFFTAHIPVYNLNLPVVPVAITYPDTAKQVAEIVACAAKFGHKVQAFSGGHSYGNYGGRAIAHGSCGQVGTGGHLTIGGLGPMSRQWGSALDHVEEVEVVLANSSIVRASRTQNQDLLFAIKGAAASFGIVTEFKIRTHPAPTQALQFSFTVNVGDTASRARFFRDWQRLVSVHNLTRKFSTELVVFQGGILVSGTFFGSEEEFKEFRLEETFPIRNPGNIVYLTDCLGMVTSKAEDLIRNAIGGLSCSFYAKSMSFTPETLIPDEGIGALFKYLDSTDKGTLVWFVIFDLEGGATNDVPVNATAYAHREAIMWMQSYAVNLLGPVSAQTKKFLNGINDIISSSRPGVQFGAYPGYVDPLIQDPQNAYWGSNLPKLQQIKASVDPNDLFHNPQSVQVVPNDN